MAEFCLECFNKLENANYTERDFILPDEDDLDLCEGCGEWKRVVIVRRKHKLLYDLATIIHIIRKDPDVKQRL